MSLAFAGISVVMGCSATKIPEHERLRAPLPIWTPQVSNAAEIATLGTYVVPSAAGAPDDIARLLSVSTSPRTIEIHRATLSIVHDAVGHGRIRRVLGALERADRAPLTVSLDTYEIPWETADGLGPFEREGHFLRVPLRRAAVARIERLVTSGDAVRLGHQSLEGTTGRWLHSMTIRQRAYLSGLEFRDAAADGVPVASPVIGLLNLGTILEATAVPSPEDNTLILAFAVTDAAPANDSVLTAWAADGQTVIPVEVDPCIEREA
ncbi:MAG: hypothetical protein ACAI25_14340, partial [Planctomycetota bacterium]